MLSVRIFGALVRIYHAKIRPSLMNDMSQIPCLLDSCTVDSTLWVLIAMMVMIWDHHWKKVDQPQEDCSDCTFTVQFTFDVPFVLIEYRISSMIAPDSTLLVLISSQLSTNYLP